ncbi:MAG: phasin family protein [Lysobacteraceae bacterium]
MVKQSKNPGIDPRDLWLAGLGVVSLTRKQALKTYGTLVEEGGQFRDATSKRIDALATQARDGLNGVKGKVEATVDPLIARASSTYGSVKGELEARLSPLVAGFTSAASSKRKPAAKKATAKTVKVSTKAAAGKTAKPAARKRAASSTAKKAA